MNSEIVSLEEAIAKGLPSYYHGKPCRRGHQSGRWVKNGACIECQRLWREAHPGYSTEHYNRPGNRERSAERTAQYKLRKRERVAGRHKPDRCEICGNGGKIVFDHCHASGSFRGWLCSNCNVALGLIKDNPATLRKLADYLEGSKGPSN